MNETLDLRGLVDRAKASRGTSVRQLAIAAQRHGFRLAYTTLNQIATGTYRFTASDDTVRAIAWLAGVSEADAFAAAGLRVPGRPFADDLPPGVDYLSPKARKAVIEILRVLVDQEAGEEHDRSAPTKHARESRAQDWVPQHPGEPDPAIRRVVAGPPAAPDGTNFGGTGSAPPASEPAAQERGHSARIERPRESPAAHLRAVDRRDLAEHRADEAREDERADLLRAAAFDTDDDLDAEVESQQQEP